jgi:hypothetical protein
MQRTYEALLPVGQPERSPVTEHIKDTGHSMKFSSTHRQARGKGYMDSIMKEAVEVQLHP